MSEDRSYLLHIRDAIEKIFAYTAEGRNRFFAETMVQDAVIRNLEVIGEATKQLSQSTREEHPDIPWKNIAGMRDLLIHRYFGVDLNAVW